uniref:Fibrous sheath-interacting protein 1 n=1 Tax=Gasterosteus aculeatus aculeatus TaxID=481459 RepID=G3NRH4_GASAC
MEIIRGSLDDISRPASSDQTSSRASSLALPHSDRMGRITPFSLVVLTKDDADIEVIDDPVKVGDERNEDSRLRRAMDEMRRLDEILSAKICTEKQVKRQRKELQAKLWQEFLVDTFVAFTPRTPPVHCRIEDEDDFVPLFETQVPDCEHIRHGQHNKNSVMVVFQEDVWAVSVRTGQGYTPEPSDLQQLTDIDSKIRLLLPAGDLLSARSSYANRSMCQVCVRRNSNGCQLPQTPSNTAQRRGRYLLEYLGCRPNYFPISHCKCSHLFTQMKLNMSY